MKRLSLLSLAALAVSGIAACGEEDFAIISPTIAHQQLTAALTGAAERPTPVTTSASGQFTAQIRDTSTIGSKRDSLAVIRFEILVSNIDSVTAAHIHAGGPNDVGPIMVSLFGSVTPTAVGLTGVLRQADVSRASTFTAPFTMDSVLTRIRAGTSYVNVHTRRNPGGEIRGQVAVTP